MDRGIHTFNKQQTPNSSSTSDAIMATGAPYTVKWGIMATGWIAEGTRKLIIILPSFLLSKKNDG